MWVMCMLDQHAQPRLENKRRASWASSQNKKEGSAEDTIAQAPSHLNHCQATPFNVETMRTSHNAAQCRFLGGASERARAALPSRSQPLMGGIGGCQLYKQDTDRGDTHRLAFVCGVGTTSACKGQRWKPPWSCCYGTIATVTASKELIWPG